jgi:uncharacterized membrane protein YedE/YeeE
MDPTSFTPFSSLFGGVLIGVAAVLMMATTGRIAGVSGFVSRLLPPYEDDEAPARLAFVAGLVLAPLLYTVVSGAKVEHVVSSNLALLGVAGLLVGAGAVIGGGCTSGHGVCGMARLSWRSMAATGMFMATAFVTVFVARHVVGG